MTVTPFAAHGEESIGAQQARALTDQIKVAVEGTWQLIERAYVTRAWAALGYRSWDDYCHREFGTARLRLPREERQEIVASLRDSGLSTRAIAVATGLSQSTIAREIPAPAESNDSAGDDDAAPVGRSQSAPKAAPRITGVDGKTYVASRPQPTQPEAVRPKRRPLGVAVGEATRELLRATERLSRITEDDRFHRNREDVHHQMPELLSALEHAVQFIRAAQPEQATANEEARRWWATSLNNLSDALADVATSIEKEHQ